MIPTSKHERRRKRNASAQAPQVPGNGAADADTAEADRAPQEATPAGVKGAPWHQTQKPWKPQQQQVIQNQERKIPSPKVPKLKARWSDGRKKTYLALVELFAGLRTTHLAAKELDSACIVMSHAAEKCEFANGLSAKNRIQETLYTDVREMSEDWAKQFVEAASKRECQVILVVAGFPCKGLSRNRIDNLPNKGFRHK